MYTMWEYSVMSNSIRRLEFGVHGPHLIGQKDAGEKALGEEQKYFGKKTGLSGEQTRNKVCDNARCIGLSGPF